MGQRTFTWTVPVSENYNDFVAEIRRRLARRVASRTRGADGQPVRREIELTQGNPSLLSTHVALVSRGMQQASINVCFHTSEGGRVERVTFSPPRVVPVEPTTITATPPRRTRTPPPSVPPRGGRPGRGEESTGEVAGAPGILSGGRIFYGVHTTRHNTMCYGAYDNASDVCHGVQTENTFSYYLHYDQGMRDYIYLMRQLGTDVVQSDAYQRRLEIFTQRTRAGRNPSTARRVDRVYREGAREGHRRLRLTNPDLPSF